MFKQRYKQLYDQVRADDKLIESVLSVAQNPAQNRSGESAAEKNSQGRSAGIGSQSTDISGRNPDMSGRSGRLTDSSHTPGSSQRSFSNRRLRRSAIAAAAACLCILLTVPVLAANVEPVYQLLYSVAPGAAQFFMPVRRTAEDNGVKMEVISAYIHDNTAEIYIGLQDLTGDRIDGTVDLFDSYSIHRPFDSSASCSLVGYDESTKTATFLIFIEEWGGGAIAGDKITFSVREFLSQKKTFEGVSIPVDLTAVEKTERTPNRVQTVSVLGGGGPDYEREVGENNVSALVPAEAMDELQVEGIELTGIGYIDGKLHVQTAVSDSLSNDNHGFFYLKDAAGNRIDCGYSFSFYNGEEGAERTDYSEFVFDVSPEEIGRYELYGDFFTSGLLTKGNWRVTFPLENGK